MMGVVSPLASEVWDELARDPGAGASIRSRGGGVGDPLPREADLALFDWDVPPMCSGSQPSWLYLQHGFTFTTCLA